MALTRKTANGGAIKFKTVPEITWSARQLTVATACSREKMIPTIPPKRAPSHGVAVPKVEAKLRLKTMEVKAPMVMIPSKPTLTIPEFSLKVPPKAVKIKGAE